MFFKDETRQPPAKRLHLASSPSIQGPYTGISPAITGDYWAEGPTAITIDGTWFVYFDRYREGRYGLVTSKDLATWTDETERLRLPEGHRHGSVIRVERSLIDRLPGAK
jgi:hypothetical protein